ncbi:MAG: hypothetical protein RCG15_05535 [Candidatus Rickettsia vulgarisii]
MLGGIAGYNSRSQGGIVGMYSKARIKTREPRYELGVLALSNYRYRALRGEILLGYNVILDDNRF